MYLFILFVYLSLKITIMFFIDFNRQLEKDFFKKNY